jgi:hypothetical protein
MLAAAAAVLFLAAGPLRRAQADLAAAALAVYLPEQLPEPLERQILAAAVVAALINLLALEELVALAVLALSFCLCPRPSTQAPQPAPRRFSLAL